MPSYAKKYTSVDEYIADYPPEVANRMRQIRKLIKELVPPKTQEVISYNIPGYKLNGPIVYFAGFAKHISVYPIRPEQTDFTKALKPYHSGTATIQFPHNLPLPVDVIQKIVKFRVKQNLGE